MWKNRPSLSHKWINKRKYIIKQFSQNILYKISCSYSSKTWDQDDNIIAWDSILIFWVCRSFVCLFNIDIWMWDQQLIISIPLLSYFWVCEYKDPGSLWYSPAFWSLVLSHFSQVWLFVILWTVAHQAPLSMGFSRQEYWSLRSAFIGVNL